MYLKDIAPGMETALRKKIFIYALFITGKKLKKKASEFPEKCQISNKNSFVSHSRII